MKFIHAADIHLDSPLVGLASYPDAPTERLRTATREAFTNLVSEALREVVDFVVIAGDLYDGTWKDFNTGIFFAREMGRLNQAGIPAYVLYGNHDAENATTNRLPLPENVYVFDPRTPTTHRIPKLKVALHGRSFKEAATDENLALTYPDPVPGWFNIGVLHTALEGNTAHANYAPCSIAQLDAKGYEYWALGHVHQHSVVGSKSSIVFPGNLQGRNIRETGERGAVLVSFDGQQIESIERLLVDVLRWHALEVDVTQAKDLGDAVRLARRSLEQLVAQSAANIPLAVRVTLRGTTAAHGELFGLEAQLRAAVIAEAAALAGDGLWIEKVKLDTAPELSAASIATRADAIADLQSLFAQAESDPDFLASLQSVLQPLTAKMPAEVVKAVPQLDAIRTEQLQGLVREIAPNLLAHLATAGGTVK
ncbi:MAG TPA: DNA repair exonuclease [Polyangiales bacterium]